MLAAAMSIKKQQRSDFQEAPQVQNVNSKKPHRKLNHFLTRKPGKQSQQDTTKAKTGVLGVVIQPIKPANNNAWESVTFQTLCQSAISVSQVQHEEQGLYGISAGLRVHKHLGSDSTSQWKATQLQLVQM